MQPVIESGGGGPAVAASWAPRGSLLATAASYSRPPRSGRLQAAWRVWSCPTERRHAEELMKKKGTVDILQQANVCWQRQAPETMTMEKLENSTGVDKKVAVGVLMLILLKGPLGSCVFTGVYNRKAHPPCILRQLMLLGFGF